MPILTAIELDRPVKDMAHWGKKGMRWGIRNGVKTGSTTSDPGGASAKKPTKSKTDKDESSTPSKSGGSSSTPVAIKPVAKKAALMSDTELRAAINRIQMERQYTDLVTPKTVAKGKSAVRQILEESAKTQAKAYATKYLGVGIEMAIKSATKGAVAPKHRK